MFVTDPKKLITKTTISTLPSATIETADVQMVSHKTATKSGRNGPSPLRQLLPVALCLISFATVLSILIIYMDTTGTPNTCL